MILDGEIPTELFREVVGEREAETRPRRLRREERIEDPLEDVRGDATSRVLRTHGEALVPGRC